MVDILLATYNGEKYLDTQIASIVNQSYSNWILYIHDDGSSDGTVNLIKKWCLFDSRIVFVDDGIAFHNPGDNFIHLLKLSTSEYVCFADQDDYWFDYKLEKMINVFPKNIEQPYLLCSNCYLWSITGITKSISFFKPKCLKEILFWNGGLQGCAMMFNAELRTRIVNTFHNHIGMHDLLLSLTAFAFGKVQYISEELFLYRSHPNSITNSNPSKSKKEYVLNGMCHKSVPVIMKKAYNDIQTFYENYKEMLKENDKKVICKYLLLLQKKSLQRFFSILFSDFSLKGSHFNLVIKVLIRPFFM